MVDVIRHTGEGGRKKWTRKTPHNLAEKSIIVHQKTAIELFRRRGNRVKWP